MDINTKSEIVNINDDNFIFSLKPHLVLIKYFSYIPADCKIKSNIFLSKNDIECFKIFGISIMTGNNSYDVLEDGYRVKEDLMFSILDYEKTHAMMKRLKTILMKKTMIFDEPNYVYNICEMAMNRLHANFKKIHENTIDKLNKIANKIADSDKNELYFKLYDNKKHMFYYIKYLLKKIKCQCVVNNIKFEFDLRKKYYIKIEKTYLFE